MTLVGLAEPSPAPGFVGRHLRYPAPESGRLAEGGRRLQGPPRASREGEPLVTVVTVCWNSERTLEQAMRSVFAQDYGNIEYIVVDAASKDGTVDLLQQHAGSIDYFISEPDRGLYHAMNKGLELATGDHVLFLNSDDWYEPDCVRALVDAKHTSGADFVSGLARYVDADGRALNDIRSMPFDASMRLRMPLRHETMLVPRALYDAVGPYDESFRIIADFELTLRLFERGCTHFEVPRVVMNFRNSGVSVTGVTKLTEERRRLIGRQFPFLAEDEVQILAEHGRLTPDTLRPMLKRHAAQTAFCRTMEMFVRDQHVAKAQRWLAMPLTDFARAPRQAPAEMTTTHSNQLKIATLCSMDHGGAGTGTQRRVEALRAHGVDARIHSLVVKSEHPYVSRVTPRLPNVDVADQDAVWAEVRKRAIAPVRAVPGYRAAELFSLPESVVSYADLKPVIDAADVVHMHWVVGMLDHEGFAESIGSKPVVWTLADMNAFTGGCHYSEGCDGYKRQCKRCPLLGGESNLAQQTWNRKREAYSKIRNLHIVCPSKWIEARVRASSLLGDRPTHQISNAFPVDRFTATNKVVARLQLGLPTDKKLILFGADSLGNKRKGGEQLKQALEMLKSLRNCADVEVVLFGSSAAGLPLASHAMGYVGDDRRLALIYSAADVFVSPSHEDSGPMTVGEAMMCGTPVVAFQVGIAMEMIEHRKTGYIARSGEAQDLAQGIQWAIGAPWHESLARSLQCQVFARDFHDPKRAAQRHVEVYKEVMRGA